MRITTVIEAGLSELGSAMVTVVDDPLFMGTLGGHKLTQEMLKEDWEQQ